jgi:hypothetical protein
MKTPKCPRCGAKPRRVTNTLRINDTPFGLDRKRVQFARCEQGHLFQVRRER